MFCFLPRESKTTEGSKQSLPRLSRRADDTQLRTGNPTVQTVSYVAVSTLYDSNQKEKSDPVRLPSADSLTYTLRTCSGSDSVHTVEHSDSSPAWEPKAFLLPVLYGTRKLQDPDWTPTGGKKTSSQDLLKKNDNIT